MVEEKKSKDSAKTLWNTIGPFIMGTTVVLSLYLFLSHVKVKDYK